MPHPLKIGRQPTSKSSCTKIGVKRGTSSPDAKISSHATMVFVLKANLNQANLFMLSAKQNCQIFLGS